MLQRPYLPLCCLQVELICDLGAIGIMVKALSDHKGSSKLVRQATIALASLVVDENCAAAIVFDSEYQIEGVPIILEAFAAHTKDAETAENCCTLVAEMAEHDDLREILIEKGTTELLTKVKLQYDGEEGDIAEYCELALDLLAGNAPADRPSTAKPVRK